MQDRVGKSGQRGGPLRRPVVPSLALASLSNQAKSSDHARVHADLRRGFPWALELLAHFLTCLEGWDALMIDGDPGPRARVTAQVRCAMLHRKRAEATQFNTVATPESDGDFVQIPCTMLSTSR